jgi:predicted Zn-dependent protease with MMP-like domain
VHGAAAPGLDGNKAASLADRPEAGYFATMSQRLPGQAVSPPPSLDHQSELARQAFATIPAELRRHVDGVIIRVDDFPDEDTEREMGLDSPFDLLGLYRGVHIGHKSSTAIANDVDMIFLYRRPLLDYWCETGEDLTEVVRHVLIHEIGHHFGLSDDDMDRIENTA